MEYYKSDYTDFVDSNGNVFYKDQPMRDNSLKTALEAATDGAVLLKNDGALPLASGAQISFFGGDSVDYLHHGTGSGKVTISTKETLKSTCEKSEYGLKVNPTLWNAYLNSGYKRGYKSGVISGGFNDANYVTYTVSEVPYSKISSAVEQSIDSYGDAAIMLIARDGGENADIDFAESGCFDDNYTDLSRTEADVLEKLVALRENGRVGKVILLINTGNAMQFKNIQNCGADAVMWWVSAARLHTTKSPPCSRARQTRTAD